MTDKVNRYITEEPLDLATLLAETEDEGSGALAVFGGTVRNTNDGRSVAGMTYDCHPSMAAKSLAALEQQVLTDFAVRQCRIMHRIGPMKLGETSVWVVVRSAHRGPAMEAARWAIDTLKERLPVWKEEHYIDGNNRHLDGTPLVAPKPER